MAGAPWPDSCEDGVTRGNDNVICRIWHGWTAPDQADAYERLLRAEILPKIRARGIAGFSRGSSCFGVRRNIGWSSLR
jgi:hypothetical protein